jgi:mitochondrial fission protein ELM1
MGWSAEEKEVVVAPKWVDGKPPVKASLAHIDLAKSDPLEGPWPDLVITAGRRLSSVALWIKRASWGRTRLVIVGKPRGRLSDFDLIVAASHYCFAGAGSAPPNVIQHDFPLMGIGRERLAEVKKAWVGRLTLLPRPLTALMVGGPTGGLRFDVETARALLRKTMAHVEKQRGSLYVTTSRRTPRAIAEWFQQACTVNDQLYLYDAEAPAEQNPYLGLLALADDFVVTPDSLSMMVEVAQLGRPLLIHPLERDTGRVERMLRTIGVLEDLSPKTDSLPAGGVAARTMARLGWPIHSRDLTAISRGLVEKGLAGWLGEPVVRPSAYSDETLDGVVARVRALLA